MHVVVVGCGRVGSSLALQLTDAGHTVAVIDRKPESFERLGSSFPGRTIAGIGFDRDRLVEAGIEEAGALASVTNGDNSNILIARVARETYGIERVVARIYDPKRAAIYQRLGIVTDTPAVEWVDPSANVSLVERQIDRGWAGHRLLDLEEAHAGVRVVALTRLGIAQLPGSQLVAQEGDIVHVAVTSDALSRLDTIFAPPIKGGR